MMGLIKADTLSALMRDLSAVMAGWGSIKVNYADKGRRPCPGLKPAWMLGFNEYIYKKYIPFIYIYFISHTRGITPSKGTPLVCRRYSFQPFFDGLGYHNDVATEVAV